MNQAHAPINRAEERRGSALLPALIAVVTVASLSAIALKSSLGTLNEERLAAARKQAFYVAEAGLAESFASLATGGGGNIGTQEKPAMLGAGYVYVEALEDEWGHFKLTSFGMVENARVRLGAVVEPEEIHLGELGFFAANNLVIGEGSQLLVGSEGQGIDTSTLPASPPPLKVQSNGTIELQGSANGNDTVIQGDVIPGPDATLSIGSGVQISGATTPAQIEIEIPTASPPEVSPYGDVVVGAGVTMSFGNRDAAADSLTLGAGSILTLVGPAKIVLDSLTLNAGARLIANGTNGPVELFVRDTLDISETASFGNSTGESSDFYLGLISELTKTEVAADVVEDAKDLLKGEAKEAVGTETVMVPQEFVLRSSTPFIGSVIAPKAALTIASGTQLLGSVVAYDLTLEPGTEAYFDQRLGETGPLLGGGIKIKSWRMLPVPPELNQANYDPGRDYEVASEVPPSMTESHQKVMMVVEGMGEDGEKYKAYVASMSEVPADMKTVLDSMDPTEVPSDSKDYEVVNDGSGDEIRLSRVKAAADNELTSEQRTRTCP
ncbi:MAG: hypothetical protein ACYS26_01505 [Planctomycetota bacterium]|jgi:hypothetical protein